MVLSLVHYYDLICVLRLPSLSFVVLQIEAMERRLLSSSSPFSFKYLKRSTFISPTNQFNSARFNFSPSTRSESRRISSTSCKHENLSPLSSSAPFFASSMLPNNLYPLPSSPDESHSLNLIANGDFQKPKV